MNSKTTTKVVIALFILIPSHKASEIAQDVEVISKP